jgi:F0F1-type ATP synthase alpha subunit
MNYIIDEKESRDDLFFKELGIVLEISDGIVTISGLYDVSFGEMMILLYQEVINQ